MQPAAPPPVRSRKEPLGRTDVPAQHAQELHRANELVKRTAAILTAAADAGSEFIIENPVDRGDRRERTYFMHEQHCPLWLMPSIESLQGRTSAKFVTFAQCMFGARYQKYTTLMYTPGLSTS